MSNRMPRVEVVSPARTATKKTEAGQAADDKPTLMLLDGNSLAFRAFYALPAENFKTQGGLTTNAVYGFTAMLINLLRDESPTHVAAAFDVSRQTFRSERYPEYKANRSSTPDEFHGQIDVTKEVLAALGITVLAKPGFEADDLIATLATQAEKEGLRVLVVTGDRDALQLVTDDVTVLYPRKGVSELTRFTPAAVVEKYGLTPEQYPDFAALRGDPSDNLPGIPGVPLEFDPKVTDGCAAGREDEQPASNRTPTADTATRCFRSLAISMPRNRAVGYTASKHRRLEI